MWTYNYLGDFLSYFVLSKNLKFDTVTLTGTALMLATAFCWMGFHEHISGSQTRWSYNCPSGLKHGMSWSLLECMSQGQSHEGKILHVVTFSFSFNNYLVRLNYTVTENMPGYSLINEFLLTVQHKQSVSLISRECDRPLWCTVDSLMCGALHARCHCTVMWIW